MRVFKTRLFKRWADGENLKDSALLEAVAEIRAGLGGFVYKKRIARQGKGKSSGSRTLIAFRINDKAFFIYGFAKNKQANISHDELKALKKLAKSLLSYNNNVLTDIVKGGALIEVKTNG